MKNSNITLNQSSELRGKLNEYWLNNALNGIQTWHFKEDNPDVEPNKSPEDLSNYELISRIETLTLENLSKGYYPFFDMDTKTANVTFTLYKELDPRVYKNLKTPNQDLFNSLYPGGITINTITIKSFTQGTLFLWLC